MPAAVAAPAAKPRTLRAADFLRWSGADEDDAFSVMLEKAAEGGGSTTIVMPPEPRVVKLSGRRSFVCPPRVQIDFGRTTIQLLSALPGNQSLVRFGAECRLLGLRLQLLPGSTAERLLTFSDDTVLDRLEVFSEAQVANAGGDNVDGMLQLRGHRIRMTAASVRGVDKPIMCWGAGASPSDPSPMTDLKIDGLTVESYVTGLHLRNIKGCEIRRYTARTRSPNARQDPGHNGMLAGRVQQFRLSDFQIENAGEHAIRFGGSPQLEELENRGIEVSDGRIAGAGKCGLKVWGGGKSDDNARDYSHEIKIRNLEAVNLGAGGRLGLNENLVHLEAVDDFELTNVGVQARNAPLSCHDGVFLAGCRNGRMVGVNVQDCARSGLWITDKVAKDESFPVHSLLARDVDIRNARGNAIHFDIIKASTGRIQLTSLEVQGAESLVGGSVAGAARSLQVSVQGRYAKLRGPAISLSGTAAETQQSIRAL